MVIINKDKHKGIILVMMNNVETIQQEPLWQQIYRILEQNIIHQKIPPGSRLSESELTKQFNVSRGPIREALLVLEREGWVETRHNYGVFIKTPNADMAKQLFEFRNLIEPQIASIAATRISQEKLVTLETIYKKEAVAVKKKDMNLIVNLNTQFHKIIAESTGNLYFCQILDNISKNVAWYLSSIYKTYSGHYRHAHYDLIESFRERDPKKAYNVMLEQLKKTSEAYLELISE
jgi:DNA-binding GntR family transcriptional regulator